MGYYLDKDQERLAKHNWYMANKEKVKARVRAYELANPDKKKKWRNDWSKKHPEFLREKANRLYHQNQEKYKGIAKKWRDKNPKFYSEFFMNQRNKAIEFYSKGKFECACCGDKRKIFLTIDHVLGNGSEHRKLIKKSKLGSWLVKNNFPDGYQILCFNCNCSKGIKVKCPCKELYKNPKDFF